MLPKNRTYLIDIHTLKGEAFTTAGVTGQTLKDILKSETVPKAFFDVRNVSDALFSHFGVNLAGIHDIQLMELATRTRSKRCVNWLAKCIDYDLALTTAEKRTWIEAKDKGRKLLAPELGGSYEVFNQRPLAEEIALYALRIFNYCQSCGVFTSTSLLPLGRPRCRLRLSNEYACRRRRLTMAKKNKWH